MRRQDRVQLFWYTVGILLTTPVLGWMFARAWAPGTIGFSLLTEFKTAIGLPAGPIGTEAVATFGLGLYFALLLVFANDVRKRFQGLLLLVGSAIVLGVLSLRGTFLPNIEWMRPLNVAGLITGFISGLCPLYFLGPSIDWEASVPGHFRLESGHSAELTTTTRVLFTIIAALVLLGGVQAWLSGTLRPFDPLAVGGFLFVMGKFLEYQASHDLQVLGPGQSGKSMFILGLYLHQLRQLREQAVSVPPQPNTNLKKQLLANLNDYNPDTDGWPTTSNQAGRRGLQPISFEFVVGDAFPTHVSLGVIDHAGQHLSDIADRLQPETPMADGGEPVQSDPQPEDVDDSGDELGAVSEELAGFDDTIATEDEPSLTMDEFYTEVTQSDTLILLLDCERYAGDDSGFVEPRLQAVELDTIVQNTSDREVILVASKADYLLDEFSGDVVDNPETYHAFRDFLTEELAADENIDTLMRDAGVDTVYPVFFETKRQGNTRVPRLDHRQQLRTVGFDHVMTRIKSNL